MDPNNVVIIPITSFIINYHDYYYY